MTEVLATLTDGETRITFEIAGPAYERLSRTLEVRMASHDRAGGQTVRQPLGFDETLELEGALFPFWRGRLQTIEDMRDAAKAMKPLLFTDGRGEVYGRWLIESVETDETLPDIQGVPRKIEFRLALGRAGRGGSVAGASAAPASGPVQGPPQ
jgi:uncharacterized protein